MYSWTANRSCEDGTQRDTRSIQRLVPDLCCESWTKFSAQTSCGEQDGGYTAEIPDRLHVHSNGGCKYYTSNDVFSRCKSGHKMATVKGDDELIQHDNKMRIWTRSGKFREVENPELSMAW